MNAGRVEFEPDPNDFIIAVMGPTASGKTNLINKLTENSESPEGRNLSSATQNITPYTIPLYGSRVVLLDTPSFDNTHHSNFAILDMIADWLTKKYPNGETLRLTGVIYLHRISDGRTSGSAHRNLELFVRLCGNLPLRRVRLVTTMWDCLEGNGPLTEEQKKRAKARKEVAEDRQKELDNDIWQPLITGGAVSRRFDNTPTSASELVDELIAVDGGKVELLLQDELVGQKKRLNETEAGKVLFSRLRKLFVEQKNVLKQFADVVKMQNDPALAKSLEDGYEKIDAVLQQTFEEIGKSKIPLSRRMYLWLFGRRSRLKAVRLSLPDIPLTKISSSEFESTSRRIDILPFLDLTPFISKTNNWHRAAGSFGDVYRCWYRTDGSSKEVAVKAFRFKYALDQGTDNRSSKMVRRELRLWGELKHDNVVPFLGIAYGFGMQDATSLVSSWMPNRSLHEFLKVYHADLEVGHRLQFLLDVANGLEYLHSFPIIHGDLRCNNILLDENYTARLADFGYTSLLGNIPEGLSYLRRSTSRPGALRWIAPEQLKKTYRWITQSDIYSFGCVALQVLSGKEPWSEVQTDAQVALRLENGEKPGRPDSQTLHDPHWDFIQRWCWSQSAKERPSAKVLAFCMQAFLNANPPSRDSAPSWLSSNL